MLALTGLGERGEIKLLRQVLPGCSISGFMSEGGVGKRHA